MSAQRRRIISTSIQVRTGKTRDSFRAQKGLKARQARKERLAPRETQALRAQKDLKAQQAPRESLVLREIPGTSAHRAPREIPESKARLDLRGRKAQKVRMAR